MKRDSCLTVGQRRSVTFGTSLQDTGGTPDSRRRAQGSVCSVCGFPFLPLPTRFSVFLRFGFSFGRRWSDVVGRLVLYEIGTLDEATPKRSI